MSNTFSQLVKYRSLISGSKFQTMMLYLPVLRRFARAGLQHQVSNNNMQHLTFKVKLADKHLSYSDIYDLRTVISLAKQSQFG